MRRKFLLVAFVLTLTTALAAVGFGQSDVVASAAGDKYVVSAKAGGVNFVEGAVMIVRKNGRSGQLLKGDRVEVGDRVVTGENGRAEILLNPGSYVRLDRSTAFQFNTTSLDNLQLRLDNGTAMFEVYAANEFRVVVNVPKAKYTLIETGVYKVEASAGGDSQVAVYKGKAMVGNVAGGEIKGGRTATVADGKLSVAKFDRDNAGEIENWSRSRSKELAKISSRIKRDALRPTLINSFYGRGWSMYDSFGLWVYDPFYGMNCFLPFGFGWSSPYGFGFGRDIWYYNLPWYIYNAPPPVRPTVPGNPQTPDAGTISRPSTRLNPNSNAGSVSRPQQPAAAISRPYQKMGGSAPVRIRPDGGSPMTTSRPGPVYVPVAPAINPGAKSRGQ